jgi:hypothetical protein
VISAIGSAMFCGCGIGFGRPKSLKDLLASIGSDAGARMVEPPGYPKSGSVCIPEGQWPGRKTSQTSCPKSLVKDNGAAASEGKE